MDDDGIVDDIDVDGVEDDVNDDDMMLSFVLVCSIQKYGNFELTSLTQSISSLST